MGWIDCGGRTVRYTVKYTGRKKTIGIRVTGPSEVEVLSPRGIGAARIEQTLLEKRAWILRRSEAFNPPRPLEEGGRVPYLGEFVPIPARVLNAPSDRRGALLRYYKRESKRIIGERVAHWGRIMGLRPNKVLVKENRSSWGTCTPKGTLNFSYRLVMAPLPMIDYVVVHELAHLAHRGHSKAFWETVSRHLPDFKDRRKWLREKGSRLSF